jgi:hypothetical protein
MKSKSITILRENLVTPLVLRLDGGFANDAPKADFPSDIQFGCYSYVLVAVVYGDGNHFVPITKCKQMNDNALFYSDGCIGKFEKLENFDTIFPSLYKHYRAHDMYYVREDALNSK